MTCARPAANALTANSCPADMIPPPLLFPSVSCGVLPRLALDSSGLLLLFFFSSVAKECIDERNSQMSTTDTANGVVSLIEISNFLVVPAVLSR